MRKTTFKNFLYRLQLASFTSTISLLLFSAASMPVGADTVIHKLPEFSAEYAITKYDIKLASATYTLRHTDTGYAMAQQTRLYGMAALFRDDTVDALSIVDTNGEQLRLKSFTYTQTGKEKNRNEKLTFSYPLTNGKHMTRIQGVVRSNPVNIKTHDTVWDILSFQIPLMIEASESRKNYPYMAVIAGELDEYTFVLSGSMDYQFAGNHYHLLKMVRTDTKKNRALHIWLAPALHNLPVIVENYRGDKLHSRMHLERVQFDHALPLENREDIDSDE